MSGTIYDEFFQQRLDPRDANPPPNEAPPLPINEAGEHPQLQPPTVEMQPFTQTPPIMRRPAENQPTNPRTLVSLILCFCGTQQLAKKKWKHEKNAYFRATLVELVIYILYLSTSCFIVYGSISPTDYYYTKVLSDLFLDTPFHGQSKTTFRTSSDVKDFWKFAESALNGLYWEQWYDDPLINREVLPQDQGILYENRIIGRPRLRQLRVVSKVCPVDHLVRSVNGKCYPHYHPDYEDKQNYVSPVPISTPTAWKYFSGENLGGRSYWGKLHTYSTAGSYLLLELKADPTKALISELKENLWIKRKTRAVFLEFTVYNSNINMFCVVKLVWEISSTGGVVPSWSIRAVRLFRYVSLFDYFIFAAEIIFIIFTIYYTIQECVELVMLGIWEYISDTWDFLDVLILILSYLCISISIYRYVLVQNEVMPLITQKKDVFADFDFLAFWEYLFNILIAISLFFISIKVFKYISFNATMSQLSTTLSKCAKDIVGFAVMFFIVFFSFAQLGYLLFGSEVQDYSTILNSIFTLLRLILGDFDFLALETANRVLGPIYFMSYVFFVFFVLLNMFLAIINDTYSEVKAENQAKKSEFLVMDYLKEKLTRRKQNQRGNVGSKGGVGDDGRISHTELKEHLKRENFEETEVDLFLTRYELTRDHLVDDDETQEVISKLETFSYDEKTQIQTGQKRRSTLNRISIPSNEIEQLDDRITTMEGSLTGALAKMDTIISKISSKNVSTGGDTYLGMIK